MATSPDTPKQPRRRIPKRRAAPDAAAPKTTPPQHDLPLGSPPGGSRPVSKDFPVGVEFAGAVATGDVTPPTVQIDNDPLVAVETAGDPGEVIRRLDGLEQGVHQLLSLMPEIQQRLGNRITEQPSERPVIIIINQIGKARSVILNQLTSGHPHPETISLGADSLADNRERMLDWMNFFAGVTVQADRIVTAFNHLIHQIDAAIPVIKHFITSITESGLVG